MRKVGVNAVLLATVAVVASLVGCAPAGEEAEPETPVAEEGAATGQEVAKTEAAQQVRVEFTGMDDDGTCTFEMTVDGVDTDDVTLHRDSAEGPVAATWLLDGGADKSWAILRPNDLDSCLDNLTGYDIKGVKGFEITGAGTTQSTAGMSECANGVYPYDLRAKLGDTFCGADPRVIIAD